MQIEAEDCKYMWTTYLNLYKYCWWLQQLSDDHKYNLTVATNIYTKIILQYLRRTKSKDIIILLRIYVWYFNICTGTRLEEDTTASVRGSKKGGTE